MTGIERMSPVDRAWLLMERPANPMVVVGLAVLAERLDQARLRSVVEERFLAFERFRCRPIVDALGGQWIPATDFDLDDHVLRAVLPGDAGQHELEKLAGELASTPLSPERPMWTFHLVENYRGGSAFILRIHHCYADGIALVRVFLSLTESRKAAGRAAKRARAARPAKGTQPEGDGLVDSLASLFAPFTHLIESVVQGGTRLVAGGLHYAVHPGDVATAARDAASLATEFARISLMPDDPTTCLKGARSGIKHVAWTEPIPFIEVSTVSHALGCTVNDVLMATLAGALGRYLASHGDAAAGPVIRAAVPVNLRTDPDAPLTLGNRFGLVFVDLPISIPHPLERLYAVRRTMQALKGSPQPLVTLGVLAAVGSLPPAAEDPALALFSAKASLVVSNLPGPREQLYLGGVPISQLLFWVPQAGSIGVGVSMLSYHEQVQLGVIADRHLIAAPGELVELMKSEFERLVLTVLMGGVPDP